MLLEAAPAPLSAWYADPLPDATALRTEAVARYQHRLRTGGPVFQLQLLMLICHDSPGTSEVDGAESVAGDERDHALLGLVRGQLLASKKLAGAVERLEHGFRLAGPLLDTADYFALLRRHELLACLPFSGTPSPQVSLASLLNEAAVVKRLRGGERESLSFERRDTVG